MNNALSERQEILADFAAEIQPQLASIARTIVELLERPGDAKIATGSLTELRMLQRAAGMLELPGFEVILAAVRKALDTLSRAEAMSPSQQAAGRELATVLLHGAEALGGGEWADAAPRRATALLFQLHSSTGPVGSGTTDGRNDRRDHRWWLRERPVIESTQDGIPKTDVYSPDPYATDVAKAQQQSARDAAAGAPGPSDETDEPTLAIAGAGMSADAPQSDRTSSNQASNEELAKLLARLKELTGAPFAATGPERVGVADEVRRTRIDDAGPMPAADDRTIAEVADILAAHEAHDADHVWVPRCLPGPGEPDVSLDEVGSRTILCRASEGSGTDGDLPAIERPAGADNSEALAVFAVERVGLVKKLVHARSAMEAEPANQGALRDLMWAAHTLHGAAALVDARAIADVCTLVERATEQLTAVGPPISANGLEFLSLAEAVLRELVAAPDAVASAAHEEMICQLATQVERVGAASAAAGQLTRTWSVLPLKPALSTRNTAVARDTIGSTDRMRLGFLNLAGEGSPQISVSAIPVTTSEESTPVSQAAAVLEMLDDAERVGSSAHGIYVSTSDLQAPSPGDAEFHAEVREIFVQEAEEHLGRINSALLSLEADRGNTAQIVAVQRAVHSLKSCSATVGLEAIADFCHVWEDALDAMEEGAKASTANVSLLMECTEALEYCLCNPDATLIRLAPLVVRLAMTSVCFQSIVLPVSPASRKRAIIDASAVATTSHIEAVQQDDDSVYIATNAPDRLDSANTDYAQPRDTAVPLVLSMTRDQAASSPTSRAWSSSQTMRVPLERFGLLSDLVGELTVQHSGLAQQLDRLSQLLDDVMPAVDRLRRLGKDLEGCSTQVTRVSAPSGVLPALSVAGSDADNHYASEFDELEFERYADNFVLGRELSELADDLATMRYDLCHLSDDARLAVTRERRITAELRDELLDMRLVPLAQLAPRLHRTVRQAALQSGKSVNLTFDGGESLLDKMVLEQISDALLHLLRNAVDHGIESTDERARVGKSPIGAVRITATRDGNEVVVQVRDDGAGIDAVKVLAQARTRGLIRPDAAGDPKLALELVFAPGLSTSPFVTELSGRGMGLDAVRAQLEQAKGTITVTSTPGDGTVFTLRLPSLAVAAAALVVLVNNQRCALPLTHVRRLLRISQEALVAVGETQLLAWDGENLQVRRLSALLGWSTPPEENPPTSLLLIVAAVGERRIALAVDEVLGWQEMVVRAPAPPFDVLPGLAGASVQADGKILPVLNLFELLKESSAASRPAPGMLRPVPATQGQPPTVLVVDDSLSVRRVVARALERHGWRVLHARDGVQALDMLGGGVPDVLLLDVEMPRMDGYELASILKKQAAYHDIPVVMLTSRCGEKHRRKAFDLGVHGYLVKPYHEPELVRVLHEAAFTIPRGAAS
jgi:chemosensory pili system protein ChpA (sensor histidine kinase/response regulator)